MSIMHKNILSTRLQNTPYMKRAYNDMHSKINFKVIVHLCTVSLGCSFIYIHICQPPTLNKRHVSQYPCGTVLLKAYYDSRPRCHKGQRLSSSHFRDSEQISLLIYLNPSSAKQESNLFFTKQA